MTSGVGCGGSGISGVDCWVSGGGCGNGKRCFGRAGGLREFLYKTNTRTINPRIMKTVIAITANMVDILEKILFRILTKKNYLS